MIPHKPARFSLTLLMLASAFAFAACTYDAVERTDTSATAAATLDPEGRPITDEEIASITSRDDFAETSEIITDEGGKIDLAGGLVYTYADGISGTETRFGVSSDASIALDDLVLQQIDQQASFFYFVAQAAAADAKAAGGQSDYANNSGDFFGCGSWSGWSFTGTYCGNHFWCFRYAQKGTYATFQRSRQCKNGVQVGNRTDFVGCGC